MENNYGSYQPDGQYPVIPNPVYQTTGRRDMGFAALLAILCIFATDMFLWGGAGLGAGICTAGLLLTGICYLARYRKRFSVYGAFCLAAYLAGAVSLAFTDNGKFSVLLLLILLSAVAILEFMDLRTHTGGDFRNIGDLCHTIFVLTFGQIGNTFYALFHKKTGEGTSQSRKIGSVLLGLVIALPVLIILVPLLMSSDAAFSGMISKFGPENLVEAAGALIFGLCLFILVFGRLLALQVVVRKPVAERTSGGVDTGVIISFLSAVVVVYLLYLFSQLSYFFGAFAGFLPKDFSVAEYARRGFFEMTLICAINLLIVFLATLLCRKKNGKVPMAVRLLELFLCLFSLVLAATSLSKIIMYVDRFGMTWLRIHTAAFILFLAVVFLAVIARLFWKKVPYIKIAMAAATILVLVSAFANVDRVIARHNVEGYLSGKYASIDMDTISNLDSDAVVPYLLELIDDQDDMVANRAKFQLSRRAVQMFVIQENTLVDDKNDLRGWNLCTAEAERLLRENFSEYYLEPEGFR